MTITQAIPKIAEVTHPDRQISEEIAEAWRRVGVWGYYKANELNRRGQLSSSASWRERCGKESHTRPKGLSGALIELGSRGERERHNVADHNFGVKIFQLCSVSSSLSHANLEQPFRTLAIKWEVYIFIKKSFSVFIIACVVYHCVCYPCVCIYYCVVVML